MSPLSTATILYVFYYVTLISHHINRSHTPMSRLSTVTTLKPNSLSFW